MSQQYQQFTQDNESQLNEDSNQDGLTKQINIFAIYIKTQQDQKLEFQYDQSKNFTVKNLKEEIFPLEAHDPNKKIKFIFKGKLLEDEKLLNSYQIEPNCFIHAMVNEIPQDNIENQVQDEIEINEQRENQIAIEVNMLLRQYLQGISTISVRRTENNNVIIQQRIQSNQHLHYGNNIDLIFGFVTGFILIFFGLLMLIFCNNLSVKYKSGLTIGIISRIIFAFLQITFYQNNQ